MFGQIVLTKLSRRLPSVSIHRFRIQNLPQESLNEFQLFFKNAHTPRPSLLTNFFAIVNRKNFSLKDLHIRSRMKKMNELRENQMYIRERHKILGPDLAAAHFIIARFGKVKFKGNDSWITLDDLIHERLPCKYEPGYVIEEIDASDTLLCYEGFENLVFLQELKSLNLSKCIFVDDWCLNRTYQFKFSLEHLDISGCENVTERGLCTLHTLKKLKTLVIRDTPNIHNKELVGILLQDILPHCDVVGVDYNDPTFLQRMNHFLS